MHGSGLQLSDEFYRSAIQPALARSHPRLRHGAGLMGRGSEVLGFDDTMSTDHDWTARAVVFLHDDTDDDRVESVQHDLRAHLPATFQGVPTGVEVVTVANYFQKQLGLIVSDQWDAYDWLSLPEHRLAAMTGGRVFHDEVGLTAVRERLAYYPRDVWYYLLSASWWRLHPEMNLVGRSGQAGDDLGSSLIAADIVSALVHLSFLVERRYAPYRKWLGTAFATLKASHALAPELQRVLRSTAWREREEALLSAYDLVATAFNALDITKAHPLQRTRLWNRPFTVAWANYPSELDAAITDPTTRELLEKWPPASGISQVRDLLWSPRSRLAVRALADR